MYTPLGLDHIVLRVRDQETAQRFYVDVLGCTLDHVNAAISLVQLRFGDHLIDLLPADGPAAAGSGLDHFCLSIACTDLKAVREALIGRGVAVGEIVERRGAFGSGPSLYLSDPDGYRIELKPR
jgi:glyoxylase I family protein